MSDTHTPHNHSYQDPSVEQSHRDDVYAEDEAPPEESYRVTGKDLMRKLRALIHEGNIRKITIRNMQGKTLIMFPVTIGVVGLVLAPVFIAIGTIAALVTECTISIERRS